MKVFFDTNVLVSAFTARGLCADLFKRTISSCTLVVSEPLLDEIRRILADKFKVAGDQIDEVIKIIAEDAVMAPAGALLRLRIRDRDDVHILSSAVHGGAEFFVTGDKEVLALKGVRGVRILTPREFWGILQVR